MTAAKPRPNTIPTVPPMAWPTKTSNTVRAASSTVVRITFMCKNFPCNYDNEYIMPVNGINKGQTTCADGERCRKYAGRKVERHGNCAVAARRSALRQGTIHAACSGRLRPDLRPLHLGYPAAVHHRRRRLRSLGGRQRSPGLDH